MASKTGTEKDSSSIDSYLKKFITKDKTLYNYLKIGNPKLGIYGSKYYVPDNKMNEFISTYKRIMFNNGNKELSYVVEKQLDKGKLALDLDFKYPPSVTTRKHGKEEIETFIELSCKILFDIFTIDKSNTIEVYVFEKPNVNTDNEDITKDGIHIIFNITMDVPSKLMFKKYLLEVIDEAFGLLKLTNSWDDVIDDSVLKGNAPWPLYGSSKPGYPPYMLTYIYNTNYEEDDELKIDSDGDNESDDDEDSYCIVMEEINIMKINFNQYFNKFCIRNTDDCITSRIVGRYMEEYESFVSNSNRKINKSVIHSGGGAISNFGFSHLPDISSIKCSGDLDKALETLFSLNDVPYALKEIHFYTMNLGPEYWEPGSHEKRIRVAWALKNTTKRLIYTWLKFCSQRPDFDYETFTFGENNDALSIWSNSDVENPDGLTFKSIIFWSKQSNPEEHARIFSRSVDYHINYAFKSNTDYDLANVLYTMFKSKFTCVNIKQNEWYEFKNHRWFVSESGITLFNKISVDMHNKFQLKFIDYKRRAFASQNNIKQPNSNETETDSVMEHERALNDIDRENLISTDISNMGNEQEDINNVLKHMLKVCNNLKTHSKKNNIISEAKAMFYDSEFDDKLDNNPYLLGCSNGIIDFRNCEFRPGKTEDYISRTTKIEYNYLSHYREKHPNIINEINTFFEQLFPIEELRTYMWEHLASTLLGTVDDQTFNIYNGSGANGKSILVDLMTMVLGEYKGTVPISLITQKRNKIGGTSSEVYNLKSVRYAVMQEPSKGDQINEGVMKELTGGDPIQCRALFKNSITFTPQFKLVVCTNTLFDITSNDDGTWRRLRKVDFMSKFIDNPNKDPRFPKKDYPYQFPVNKKIKEKFPTWAPILLAMLADIAFKTKGQVKDVDIVLEATQKYRQNQDVLLEFVDKFIDDETPSELNMGIKQKDIINKFKDWFNTNHASSAGGPKSAMPIGKDIIGYFEKRFGPYPGKTGWLNFSYKRAISYINEDSDDEVIESTDFE